MTELPSGLELARTTSEFDAGSVPAGLLRTHRVADGVWGRLRVKAGTLTLVFEDDGESVMVGSGQAAVIPPGRPHHIEPAAGVRFCVEFHR